MTDSSLWIGGRARIDSGYEWSDETAFDFDNWDDGEPSDMEGESLLSVFSCLPAAAVDVINLDIIKFLSVFMCICYCCNTAATACVCTVIL